jgi:CubicO group peptidase (beta-lactamase class C family)
LKRLLKFLGLGLLLILVVLTGVVLSDFTFWKRLVTAPVSDMATAIDWYAPLETVPGSDGAQWVSRTVPTLSEATQTALIEYGTATGSVALVVWHDGELILENYWPGYTQDSRTDPASMHKTVMAMLVGIAIERGLIPSVDAKAALWLEEWRDDARADVTIEQLLQMASGLALVPFDPNPFGKYFRTLLGTDLIPVYLAIPQEKMPGSEFAYNNVNAQALGILLQRAAGQRYAELLSEALWSKLGVGDAYLWLDREKGMPRTFCCIQTTARAWVQIGRLLANRGELDGQQVVPAAWIEAMLRPSSGNPNYGYQTWLGTEYVEQRAYNRTVSVTAHHSEPFVADDIVFLDGFGGQRVYVIPSQRLVIVRTGAPQLAWDDARLPNVVLRDPRFQE